MPSKRFPNHRYRDLIDKISQFSTERSWTKFHNPKDLSIALLVEAGELLEHFTWTNSSESHKLFDNSRKREDIEDEVADVMIYLLQFINAVGIDLDTAIKRKIQKNAKKYPVEKSKGNTRKYTDFS
jgi:NTP pyrophosphatase (non-canonical NTP hydrolase)